MRTLLAFVGSIVTMCMLAGCGPSTAPTGPTPTPARPTSFGVITESSASLGSSFSTCLSGSAAPSCFSARIRLGSIAVSAATAPTTPLNLVATSLGNSVTLSWSAPGAGDPVTSYVIEAGSAPGLANLANFSTGRALTVFGASGVGAGTYYVRVRAANAAGTSAPSNEAVLVVGGSPGVPPGAPTGLTIILNSGGTVGLAWNASSGSPTTYIIEAGSQPGLANLANSDLGSAATTLTATGVGAGTYYVRVRAKNAYGISAPSNEVIITVGTPVCTREPVNLDFAANYVTTVPVGPSAGLTATFAIGLLPGSDVFVQGTYVDAAGGTGALGGFISGLALARGSFPAAQMSFVPFNSDVVTYSAMFIGDPTVCVGNRVLVLAGNAYMGYVGSRPCQPGETCPDGATHLRGPGYPMTLTRR